MRHGWRGGEAGRRHGCLAGRRELQARMTSRHGTGRAAVQVQSTQSRAAQLRQPLLRERRRSSPPGELLGAAAAGGR